MEVTPGVRRLIHQAAPSHQLRSKLREDGVGTLRDEGVRLAMRGQSSLEEVLRATHTDDVSGGEQATGTKGRGSPDGASGSRRAVA